MSNSLCKSSVFKAYQDVIADVITNVRDHFLEDGVDETVLQELKTLWETKLAATKAVEETKEIEKPAVQNTKASNKQQQQQQQQQQNQNKNQNFNTHTPQDHQQVNKQVVGQVPPNNHMPQGIPFPEWRRVPVRLTIPSPPGSGEDQRILGIEVPEVFLQGHHLKSILTGPVISATMNLPLMAASAYLQDHVNNAFLKHQQQTNFININMDVNPSILQSDGTYDYRGECTKLHKHKKDKEKTKPLDVPQGDAPADSSDDDENDDDEDDVDQDEDREDDDIEEERGEVTEEEPLNSGDDVSDADGTEESFETENVIVCQYDKITRARNRWKFHLKDGIMNLNGEDYIFQKANGDAEW